MEEDRGKSAFPKAARLLARAEFDRVFQDAVKSSDQCFTVLARPNSLGHARLGLIISRKSVSHAVQRSRIKRIIRESFRQRQHTLDSLDFVVLARKGLDNMQNPVVFQSLDKHWLRLVQKCARS